MANRILWVTQPDPELGNYPTILYSDVKGSWPVIGNINTDPLFVLSEKGDYRLLWGSPCIDAGFPDSLDADGTRSDMGAHSFDQDDYLTLYMPPETSEVSPGAQLGVTCTLINRWSEPEQCWFTSRIHLQGGRTFPVIETTEYTVPAEYVFQVHLEHDIPTVAPPRYCEYRALIGLPPGALYDRDSFSFSVGE